MIVEISTQMRHRYGLLDREEHATANEQVPVGDVSVTSTVVGGDDWLVVAIGLERGTVFVALPGGDPAEVDRAVWSNVFIDMIGDGESTLVVGVGSGFELAVGSGLMPWTGSYVDLIGADGQITITTRGCFFDYITPQTDLAGTPEAHERVGTVLLGDDSAMSCASGNTVRDEGDGIIRRGDAERTQRAARTQTLNSARTACPYGYSRMHPLQVAQKAGYASSG